MATPFDELREANDAYHAAANEIMEANADTFGVPVGEMMEVKAKFGAYHNSIFQLMKEAQALLEPYFEGGE